MKQSQKIQHSEGVNLIGGGQVLPGHIDEIIENGLPVYCADAGYLVAKNAGLVVSAVIGDFDSVAFSDDLECAQIKIEDQDRNDLEKSLDVINATYLLCYGFLGGRMDHSLAAFNAIAKTPKPAFLIGQEDVCVVCPPKLNLDLPIETRFSVFPLAPTQARSTGLVWDLDAHDLDPLGRVSTSNRTAKPEISVAIESGTALVIFPRAQLNTFLEQWPI